MNITDQLKRPFDPKVVHWRVGATSGDKTKGIALAYIDARDAMKRLDDVCGDNWQCEYPFEGCCRIGIKINGDWVWRSNGAGETNVEGEKGQYSDAFKRAAVLWGVGRYLYYLPNVWCPLKAKGRSYVLAEAPQLPAWALPGAEDRNYGDALRNNMQSIMIIRGAIEDGCLDVANEAWNEIPQNERDALWVAPTKGGVFTTKEREVIKSREFRIALTGEEE